MNVIGFLMYALLFNNNALLTSEICGKELIGSLSVN